jgi:hypothetical protein
MEMVIPNALHEADRVQSAFLIDMERIVLTMIDHQP